MLLARTGEYSSNIRARPFPQGWLDNNFHLYLYSVHETCGSEEISPKEATAKTMNDFLWFHQELCEIYKSQIDLYKRGIVDRLLQSFSNIKKEAEDEGERLFNLPVSNPDIDPAENAEHIQDKVFTYYENLKETQDMLFGFAVVGLYHLWERQVIVFLKREIKHLHNEPDIKNWEHIKSSLATYSINFEEVPSFNCLNELRLVANVIKHGEGQSKTTLEELNPQLFEIACRDFSIPIGDAILDPKLFLDHKDFDRYHQATINFWDYKYWQSKGERFKRK